MNFHDVYFLSIQSTYNDVQAALYRHKTQLELSVIKKIDASANLIPSLDTMFKSHHLKLDKLSFIAVNQGPAPFTTLRVVIASVNGISFASNMPLIGIDGLDALLMEYHDELSIPTVVLLDAFTNDVYYAIQGSAKNVQKGCMPVVNLLDEVVHQYSHGQIRFIGNGALLHKELIKKVVQDRAIIPELHFTSINQIAQMGLHKWKAQEGLAKQVLPLYLKKQWWQAHSAPPCSRK